MRFKWNWNWNWNQEIVLEVREAQVREKTEEAIFDRKPISSYHIQSFYIPLLILFFAYIIPSCLIYTPLLIHIIFNLRLYHPSYLILLPLLPSTSPSHLPLLHASLSRISPSWTGHREIASCYWDGDGVYREHYGAPMDQSESPED